MTRLSRPCYDKMHRCPGWVGGGYKSAKRNLCPCHGYVQVDYEAPLWKWRVHRCDQCDVVVLPYAVRWVDPTWLGTKLRLAAQRLVRR